MIRLTAILLKKKRRGYPYLYLWTRVKQILGGMGGGEPPREVGGAAGEHAGVAADDPVLTALSSAPDPWGRYFMGFFLELLCSNCPIL